MKTKLILLTRLLAPNSISQTIYLSCLILIICFSFRDNSELDFFWHVLIGKDILSNFRFTGDPNWIWGPSDKDWVTTQPLAEIVMYFIWSIGGPITISLARLTLSLFLLLALYLQIFNYCFYNFKHRFMRLNIGLLLISSWILLIPFVQERPNSFTIFLTFLVGREIPKLISFNAEPRFPVLFLIFFLWPFIHGGWILAYSALVLTLFFRTYVSRGRVRSRLSKKVFWVFFALPPTLTLLTPAKISYFPTTIEIASLGRKFISEWQSLISFNEGTTVILFSVYVISFAIVLWNKLQGEKTLSDIRFILFQFTYCVGLLMAAIVSIRNVPLVILLTLPLICSIDKGYETSLSQSAQHFAKKVKNLNLLPVLGLLISIVFSINQSTHANILDVNERPMRIYSEISKLGEPHTFFNSPNEGGELIYFGQGRASVFMDGRVDKYPLALHAGIGDFLARKGNWRNFEKRYLGCASDALLTKNNPIVQEMNQLGFELKMRDGDFVWFVRTSPLVMVQNCG